MSDPEEERALKYELAIAQAEEGEALRRVRRLTAVGEYSEIHAAMREAESCHSRANELARAIKSARG